MTNSVAEIKYRSTGVTVCVTGLTARPIVGTVYKDCTLYRQFDGVVDQTHRAAIVAACRQAFKKVEDVTIALETGEVINAGFVVRESVQPAQSLKADRGAQPARAISKAQKWDDMYNEGGDGYNPYRY
jgi:hypothetical protein